MVFITLSGLQFQGRMDFPGVLYIKSLVFHKIGLSGESVLDKGQKIDGAGEIESINIIDCRVPPAVASSPAGSCWGVMPGFKNVTMKKEANVFDLCG